MAVPFPAPGTQPQPLPLRQGAPQGRGLRRNLLKILGLTVGLLLCIVFVVINRPTQAPISQRKAEATPQLGYVTDALRTLPESYSKLTQAAPTEPPAPAPPPAKPAQPLPAAAPATRAPESKPSSGMNLKQPGERRTTPSAPVALVPSHAPVDGQGAPKLTENEDWRERQGRLKATQVSDRLHTPESPYMILAGTWIPAALESGINSQLPGHLKARVRQHVYDTVTGHHLLIPQNTVLIGEYDSKVVYGEDRVMVIWTRLLMPNGMSIQLEGMDGVDMAGYSGLKDKVDNHYWKLLGAVLMSSVLSMGARVPFGTPGQNEYYQTMPQQFAQEFGQAANQAGQQIVRRQLSVPPTIKIRPGMSLNVFVHRDLVLQPYQWGVATVPGRQ